MMDEDFNDWDDDDKPSIWERFRDYLRGLWLRLFPSTEPRPYDERKEWQFAGPECCGAPTIGQTTAGMPGAEALTTFECRACGKVTDGAGKLLIPPRWTAARVHPD